MNKNIKINISNKIAEITLNRPETVSYTHLRAHETDS